MRFATFNVSLFGRQPGEIAERLADPNDPQAQHVAEIIQRARPDVLLLNEFDYDESGTALRRFRNNYLARPQHVSGDPAGAAKTIDYPHVFAAPSNTGAPSGFDLNRDGAIGGELGSEAYAGDCWGFGRYPGQYGMAVLSRLPLDESRIRTFRTFPWRDLPGARLPDDSASAGPVDWYPSEASAQFPLSSKSHWDVPVLCGERTVHLLASHPTPPTYDGPEDRNGLRNCDEIRFWLHYVGGTDDSQALYDDRGVRGGLAPAKSFVIAGDLNGDPHDGDGPEGIRQLLASPRIQTSPVPASRGAAEQAQLQGGANRRHAGDPAHDTCDPADDPGPGNLRIDYVLPSHDLRIVDCGVWWPASDDPLSRLTGTYPFPSSDHRLVWIDVAVGPAAESPAP